MQTSKLNEFIYIYICLFLLCVKNKTKQVHQQMYGELAATKQRPSLITVARNIYRSHGIGGTSFSHKYEQHFSLEL